MTLPSVVSRSTGGSGPTDVLSHPVTLPAGSDTVGNLLLVIWAYGGGSTTLSYGNWNYSTGTTGTVSTQLVWKISTGSDTLTFMTGAARQSSYVAYNIANATGVTTVSGTASAGANINPIGVTMPAYTDALVIASRVSAVQDSASAPPAGYSNMQSVQSQSVSNGTSINAAECQVANAMVFDPGPFTSPATFAYTYTQIVTCLPKLDTFTDSFDAQIAPDRWYDYGTVAWENGQAKLTCRPVDYSGIYQQQLFDLTNSSIQAKITPPPAAASRETAMVIRNYKGDGMSVHISGSPPTLILRRRTPSANDTTVPYDPVAHAWLRLVYYNGTTMYWEASPDGQIWTLLRTTSVAIELTSVVTELSVGQYAAEADVQPGYFDNVNTSGLPTKRPKVWTGSAWVEKPMKAWDGSAWVEKPIKVWNGSTWVLANKQMPRPEPKLVRSGRGASAAYVDVDVTGGRTLIVIRNATSTSLASDNAGVTLLHTDTGGPRRNSIWAIAPGTTGTVRITGSSTALWGYLLLDRPGRYQFATYVASNATDIIEAQTTPVYSPFTRLVACWNVNNSADWVPPTGWTMLETITTQNAEPSWMIGYTNTMVPLGINPIPLVNRGKNGTTRIELVSVIDAM